MRLSPRIGTALVALWVMTSACASLASGGRERTVTAPPVAATTNAAGEEIVVRTNAERKKLGLPALARNTALMKAAQLHADQMAALNKMAHTLPDASYPSPGSRLDAAGHPRFGT